MGKNNGVWRQHIPKRIAEKKRLEAKVDDVVVGAREGICGEDGYAGRTPDRYACHYCGQYHLKPISTGGLYEQATHATHATPVGK
jgi:hypothetical protein